jgi:hypothetical protein
MMYMVGFRFSLGLGAYGVGSNCVVLGNRV